MDHKFRFAVFAAVSSDPQAREDKASLGDQVNTARAAGLQQGGVETTKPFILDGYSRTGYVNLSDALADIPPLAEAIEAAEQNKYDVLIMDNIERMGDLAPMLSTLFKQHKKQLHSARQSGKIYEPSTYDPSSDEASDIMIRVEGIIQKYRINKMRRGYNIGIPERIKKGLPPLTIAYGYDRISNKEPPVQNDNVIYILKMKDWFLEGRPMTWIAEQLMQAGAPLPRGFSKRWYTASIRHILYNPFYAGIVAVGQKRAAPSKHGGLTWERTPQSEWTWAKGKHKALWGEDTLLAIENEFARRLTLKNYAKTVYPLAGLLRCTVCKQKLIRRRTSRDGIYMPGIGCKSGHAHVVMEYDAAVQRVATELYKAIKDLKDRPLRTQEETARLLADLDHIKARRANVHEGFEAGIYTKEEASSRIKELERQEKTRQRDLEELELTQQTRSQFRAISSTLMGYGEAGTYIWITEDEPAVVNRMLSGLCQAIWISPENEISFEWRE